ncbi:MAG: hypothetical protein CME70_11990 [Halobacteriovorax sp.]|nr:hypothetical protein [Halobacteriovorax sp.]|tara:strand:+ start:316603 stop:316926 length:324 start_codon:yes stop_codon:yes gene_type:complete
MKKFIALTAALLSLSAFAGRYDRVELVRVKGETAQGVFAEAQAMAAEINADRWGRTKFSYLRTCNPTHGDFEDSNTFRRKAFASSSKVYLNHVTGMYTAILDVRCED